MKKLTLMAAAIACAFTVNAPVADASIRDLAFGAREMVYNARYVFYRGARPGNIIVPPTYLRSTLRRTMNRITRDYRKPGHHVNGVILNSPVRTAYYTGTFIKVVRNGNQTRIYLSGRGSAHNADVASLEYYLARAVEDAKRYSSYVKFSDVNYGRRYVLDTGGSHSPKIVEDNVFVTIHGDMNQPRHAYVLTRLAYYIGAL